VDSDDIFCPANASLSRKACSCRRFVSEVVEIHGYDPDRDEFNYGFIFDSHKELV
jgi:hypothetical protein